MVKHFCNRCNKELNLADNYILADVRIRRGLPRENHTIELCMDCVDKAFGEGFADRCEAEYAEKKKAEQAYRAARLAKKNEQEG